MKILSPEQLHQADQKTIENEKIASWQLMERASLKAVEKLKEILPNDCKVTILAGSGNNGGDGLAIAYHLDQMGYQVEVNLIEYAPKLSDDCHTNLKRLESDNSIDINRYDKNSDISELNFNEVIIDAIFGIGLNRDLPDFVQKIITESNQINALRIAIDVPSGLFLTQLTPEDAVVFLAEHTLSFQCPKLNFFLPDYGNCLGKVSVIDIGLDQDFISNLNNDFEYIDKNLVKTILKTRKRFQS